MLVDCTLLHSIDLWDYRQFLKEAVEQLRTQSPKLSYASLSRRFGFRSRSFLQHVLDQEKHLSVESADRIATVLKLRDRDRNLFIALIRLAHADGKSDPSTGVNPAQKLRRYIERSRSKINHNFDKPNPQESETVYANLDSILVYSALGTKELGASVDQIVTRTKLSKRSVLIELNRLNERGIIARDEASGRYKLLSSFIFEDSKSAQNFVKDFYLSLSKEAIKSAQDGFSDPNKLFVAYTLSVESKRMPEFKSKMKRLLSEFVLQSEEAEGDHIAKLHLALL